MIRAALLAAAVLLAACGTAEVPPDGGVVGDAPRPPASLTLGEGESTFRPIASGDTLLIARGCQGSQHVWIGLRTRNLIPRGATIRLDLLDATTRERISLELYVRLSLEDAGGGESQLLGITLQVPVPDDAIDRDLILRGEVSDNDGASASAEVPVHVAWGTEICGG